MVNDSILKYVRYMRAKGITDEKMREALMAQGWNESEITSALWYDANKAADEQKNSLEQKEKDKSPFLIFSIILALIWAAVLLYLRLWNPSWNPMPLPPENVIDKLLF